MANSKNNESETRQVWLMDRITSVKEGLLILSHLAFFKKNEVVLDSSLSGVHLLKKRGEAKPIK